MNLKEIKEMINLMNENNLSELEVEKDGLKISIKKGADTTRVERVSQGKPSEIAEVKEKIKKEAKELFEITSPMVGTFYRAPSPDAEPFVEVGKTIEENQVICIIEAMKLMNEIKSEVKGKIVEILVENGQTIEFGQPLFSVEKT